MQPTTSPPSPESKNSTIQRIGWAILIVLTLYICYFSHLDVIGFVGPDEPRYAWIARDMAETGDWVTPRLYGKPWFEKPPLLYWGGAVFFKLLGEGRPEIAARLPSAIGALLATLALAWLAWRTYGEECARWLLLLLPTSVGMIGFSHACATDMPFAGMLTVAMVCAAVVLGIARKPEDTPILPHTPWLALLLFGFFLGLAVLAKGPAAIILTGGAVFFWAIFTKRWRDAFRLLHPAAIASFCATALPWYILCAHRNPDFFRIFIIEHNFKRYLTPEFQHIQPFWFYVPVLLVAFLPWTVVLGWAAALGSRRVSQLPPIELLFACWAAFCLVFFSISQSKLPGYILPAIPAIGLLFTRSLRSQGQKDVRAFRIGAAVGSLLFFLAALALLEIGRITANHSHLNGKAGSAYGLLALCFAAANFFLVFVQRETGAVQKLAAPLLTTLPMLVVLWFAPFFVASSFEYDPSGKTLADEIRRPDVEESNVYIGPVDRAKHFSLNFYMWREIPDWDPTRQVEGLLILRSARCGQLVRAPYSCNRADWLEGAGAYLYSVKRDDSLDGVGGKTQ